MNSHSDNFDPPPRKAKARHIACSTVVYDFSKRPIECKTQNTKPSFSSESMRPGDEIWRAVARRIRCVGEFSVFIDHKWGYRFRLPPKYREKLGDLLSQTWVVSFWSNKCLRLVPECVWTVYLEHLRVGGMRDDLVKNVIVGSAQSVEFVSRERLSLPKETIQDLDIFGTNKANLVPGDVWIELWDLTTRKHIVLQGQKELTAMNGTPAQSCPAGTDATSKPAQSLKMTVGNASRTMGADLKKKKKASRNNKRRNER